MIDDDEIVAPAAGTLIPINKVNDPVFAQKMMGDGVAFNYVQGKVVLCAPANGKLSVLYPTGHAFGISMNQGTELLVHIGLDTVKAKGSGFRVLKQKGNSVLAGEPIVEVNLKKLRKLYDMTTMLIVTNDGGLTPKFIDSGTVSRGQDILR